MKPSDLAFLSLSRRPVSSLLAVASLGFALGLGGWLLNLHSSVFASIEVREPGVDAVLGPKSNGLSILLDSVHLAGGNTECLDYFLINTLAKEVTPEMLIPLAVFADWRGFPVVGTEDSFIHRPEKSAPPKLASGRWYNLTVPEVVVGSEVAQRSGLEVGQTLVATAVYSGTEGQPVWVKPMTVVGVLAESGLPRDRGIYCDIRHAWECQSGAILAGSLPMVKRGRGVTCFLLGLDPKRPESLDLLEEVVHVGTAAQVILVEEEISGLRSLLGQGRQALAGITVLLVLLAIAIASLLFNERFETVKKELGVLRALGYSRGQVARALFWEGFFVAVLGICGGMILERIGALATPLLWNPPWLLHPSWPNNVLLALWGASLIGSAAACLPVLIRLYRWDGHDALKGM
jgi:putative ABC transport system permease protein